MTRSSKHLLPFDHTPIVAAQLTFNFPSTFFPLDQFAYDASPDSCKTAVRAACCGCLPLHVSLCLISEFCVVYFSGISFVGVDVTESTCNE